MKKRYNYTLIIASFLIFISCSENATGPGNLRLNQGEGAFTVSGAINAQHEGKAWDKIDRSDNGTLLQIFVSNAEFSNDPHENGDASFVLEFRLESGSESFSISKGEYNLGADAPFHGLFADAATTMAFETNGESGGFIAITSYYSTGSVEAEFDFSASTIDGGSSVTVSGGIRASCIGGQYNPNC